MQITLSQYAGFCDGVERAYQMVKKIALDSETPKPIFVLGSLVHNSDVVENIEKMGVRKIKVDAHLFENLESMNPPVDSGTLVVTAHGMGPKIFEFCRERNINLVDTTCPRVIKAQRLAKLFLNKDYQIVMIGEKKHKEVRGINEWADERLIFVENEKYLKGLSLDPELPIVVLSQTTQNQEFVKKAAEFIQKKYPKTEVMDTVCLATHERQSEVKKLAEKNDVTIVIGSPKSSNSTRLFEIAKKRNARTYFVQNADQIEKDWFRDCQKVGVTAGASTPKWIIEEVLEKIKNRLR